MIPFDGQVVRILLVEDEPAHAELVRRAFLASNFANIFRLTRVNTLHAAHEALEQSPPDLVIADLVLPDGRGLELLTQASGQIPPFPLILMTSHGDETVAVEAMRAGALDYVVKSPTTLLDLPRLAERALREWAHVVERRRTEQELRRLKEFNEGIVQAMAEGIIVEDVAGCCTFINPAGATLLGYRPEELIGVHWSRLAPPELHGVVAAANQRRKQGLVDQYEMEMLCKDGRTISTLISGSPRWEGQEVGGTLAVFTDITARKHAEEESRHLLEQVRDQALQVQQIIDTVPEGVIMLDAGGRVVRANPLGEKDLMALGKVHVGETLTYLGGQPLLAFLSPPPKGMWHQLSVENRHFQVIARALESSSPMKGWVLVVRDVTQEYETRQHTERQMRLAAVGQLAAGIAHDFNNIMAAIILYSQIVSQASDLSVVNRSRLAVINRQAQHAANLIDQILDFSRRTVMERQPLNLLPVLKEQVKMLQRTLPENIRVAFIYRPEDEKADRYIINGDPTRIQQVVMNLAVNARDAMPLGGELHIVLEHLHFDAQAPPPLPGMAEGEWLRLTISDTGTGIPPELMSRIYEPFFTTKPPGKGSGLGLAQVHGIIKLHEGEIDVESQVGLGTAFMIYLPALQTGTIEASVQEGQLEQGCGEHLLVVEDDRATREALMDGLEMLNYHVDAVSNGQEALMFLAQHPDSVRLIVSDVVMPKMGGTLMLYTLRQGGVEVPVLFLTGHPFDEEVVKLQSLGNTAWLSKPSNLIQLSQKISELLRKGAG